ncbi:hypothetical protein B0H14DRAFT_1464296 [Mycena olivaceomarginata]|nr:hypothetical protein B0H14DRAFT_1464296 [Mycena olivaceomarginata]
MTPWEVSAVAFRFCANWLSESTQSSMNQSSKFSTFFAACPALQEVFVNGGRHGGETPAIVDLPSAQFIRYSASNSWPNHVRVLTSAVNLVDCVLRLIDLPTPGSPIVLLPQLRRLSTSTAAVLEHLDTPALRELYCCDYSPDLPAFLTRCPHLERLFLGWIATEADVGVLLRAAPTVRNLFLYIPIDLASDLFSLLETPTLSADPERPATIPVLDTLSLGLVPINGSDDLVDEDQLMRAVEGRWQHGSLRSLKLWGMRFAPSVATLGRMEALRAQGMQVILHERSDDLYTEMMPPRFSAQ